MENLAAVFFFILVSNVASYMTSEKDSFYLWMQKSQMSILSLLCFLSSLVIQDDLYSDEKVFFCFVLYKNYYFK